MTKEITFIKEVLKRAKFTQATEDSPRFFSLNLGEITELENKHHMRFYLELDKISKEEQEKLLDPYFNKV